MLTEILHQAQDFLAQAQAAIALAPTPAPGEGGSDSLVNTTGFVKFLIAWIAPFPLAFLGLIFLGRARNGEVSKVLTSSGIAVVGLAFIGGALSLPFIGDDIVGLVLGTK